MEIVWKRKTILVPELKAQYCVEMTEEKKAKILVVEDERAIADTILFALETEGFTAEWCGTASRGMAAVERDSFDLVILDIGLPDYSGLELCKRIRKVSPVPLFFLTARSEEIDRVIGLELGADDYIAKPFSPRELTARIKALFRRLSVQAPANQKAKAFFLDLERACIQFRGKALDLTKTEFKLLKLLLQRPGRVYSRQEIMDRISDSPDMSLDRTIDSHIKFLRSKLRGVDPSREWVVTHRGFGYSLAEGEE